MLGTNNAFRLLFLVEPVLYRLLTKVANLKL